MRYIVVRLERAPDCECNSCHVKLGKGYTRDLSTGLVYHNPCCYATHVHDSIIALGGYDNATVEVSYP